MQRMLRDDRFQSPYEPEDDSLWLPAQMLHAMGSILSQSDDTQTDMLKVSLCSVEILHLLKKIRFLFSEFLLGFIASGLFFLLDDERPLDNCHSHYLLRGFRKWESGSENCRSGCNQPNSAIFLPVFR